MFYVLNEVLRFIEDNNIIINNGYIFYVIYINNLDETIKLTLKYS